MEEKGDVLVVAKAIPPVIGGIEAYSAELADAYTKWGFFTTLVTPAVELQLRESERLDRIDGTRRSAPQWTAFISVLRRLSRLRGRHWRLIHATSWRMCLPIILLRMPGQLIVTIHGREITEQTWLMRWLAKRVLRAATLLVYVSDSTRRESHAALPWIGVIPSIVAWNGTSTNPDARELDHAPAKSKHHPLLILSVCRLVRRKNLPFAIRVIGELQRRVGPSFRYVITGGGPERPKLIEAIEALGDSGSCVHLAGSVSEDELRRLYDQADIFFHPQSSAHDPRDIEGFGISIIDAMARGVPVVCGRDGGPSEYIIDGMNGFLVDGLDEKQAADVLEKLVLAPELRARIGATGKRLVEQRMTWMQHIEAILCRAELHGRR